LATNVYTTGQEVLLNATFTNASGTFIDPTVIVCRVRDPLGVVTLPSVAQAGSGTGFWYAQYTPLIEGLFYYRWEGDKITNEGQFVVKKSVFN